MNGSRFASRLLVLFATLASAACRSRPAPAVLTVDGSTTTYPIVSAIGEDYGRREPDVEVVVNRSGTGSGFQKFTRGELDIATASRRIKPEEELALRRAGIDYLELPIAYDGVSVIVNPANSWASGLTLEQLRRAWAPGSLVKTWRDLDPRFPDEPIDFYGPTDNHGTFEYFTEMVLGRTDDIRADYVPNPEYTAIIQAIAGDRNGIAFVGYSYYDTNRDQVKALPINGVAPTAATIRSGRYRPLSRPLFLYVSRAALQRKPCVRRFLEFATGRNGIDDITEARYVALPAATYGVLRRRVAAEFKGGVVIAGRP